MWKYEIFPQVADLSATKQPNYKIWLLYNIISNGYSQVFFENLLPNQRFGVGIAKFAIPTCDNHYIQHIWYCKIENYVL